MRILDSTQKKVKVFYVAFMFVLILSLFVPVAHSSNLYVEVNNNEIVEILPFKYNEYYGERFYFGFSQNPDNLNFEASTPDVIEINIESSIRHFFFFENIDFERNYIITMNGINKTVSFCNNDGICQPCLEWPCENIENFLTCPNDCPSGSKDNYCDLQRDGICDPDCIYHDFDCDECIENICIYEGYQPEDIICSQLGGTNCPIDKRCEGYYTYADDTQGFCCIGSCVDERLSSASQNLFAAEHDRVDDKISESEFDIEFWGLIGLMIFFIVVAIVVVVISEYKKIHEEHKVRKYVYDLVKSGYGIDQVETSLKQQNIEQSMIAKILRKYKK